MNMFSLITKEVFVLGTAAVYLVNLLELLCLPSRLNYVSQAGAFLLQTHNH